MEQIMNFFIHQFDNCRIVKLNATNKNRFSKVNTFQHSPAYLESVNWGKLILNGISSVRTVMCLVNN